MNQTTPTDDLTRSSRQPEARGLQSDSLRALCSPHLAPSYRPALMAQARRRRTARIAGRFIESFESHLGPELTSPLEGLLEHSGARDPHLDRALLILNVGLHLGAEAAREAAVRALLHLSSGGARVSIDQTLPARARFLWRGYLLMPATRVRLDASDPGRLELCASREAHILEGDALSARRDIYALPRVMLGDPDLDGPHAQLLLAWSRQACPVLVTSAPPAVLPAGEVQARVQEGWDVVSAASSEFAGWCGEVLADIVPTAGGPNYSMSASSREAPGQLAVSVPAAPSVLAELLVHECSHAYLGLARELGPLDDGSDATLYWSPVRRAHRPIDRILLAHHAFINILRFQQAVIEQGLDHDGYARSSRAFNVGAIQALESGLEKTRALTEVGRALFLPLEAALS